MNFDMVMFHQAFFEEATDLLSDLEGHLLRLEETPDDLELLSAIFRCAHSIKGGSATFGFADIAHFTHGLETLLDKVRNGQIAVNPALTSVLLASLDQMKALLSAARGDSPNAPDSTALTARIEAMSAGEFPAEDLPEKSPPQMETSAENEITEGEDFGFFNAVRTYDFVFSPGLDTLRQGADPLLLLRRLSDACEILALHCDISMLPPLAELDPEVCCLRWKLELRTDKEPDEILEIFEFIADESEIVLIQKTENRKQKTEKDAPDVVGAPLAAPSLRFAAPLPADAAPASGNSAPFLAEGSESRTPTTALIPEIKETNEGMTPLPRLRGQGVGAKPETQTLRVATDKIDRLINLVGELVINQSMLNEVIQGFSMAKLPRLIEAVGEMERASRELQERVMAVRMLPIKHAFGRFPRLARDLSLSCSKKVELKTSGEETELDKSVIEAIADPLTHLVRNSIDHGMETPEERKQVGKSATGLVSLHAFHEGGNIVIEVSDDGRGLNRDKILKKAVERGLIADGDLLTDDAVNNLIFHPGFSTAEKVTDVSGRGVGMDIVKQSVQALGGSITLSTVPGAGTRFRIRLPLTMAILEGLSLSVGSEVYILPLTSIVESIRPKPGDVRVVAGRAEVVLVRGEVLPILRLYQVFGADPLVTEPTQALLVIVENDGRKVALLVDELIGQSQVVIKSLESNYRKVEGIAGATILGDGRVALILDVPGLIQGSALGNPSYAAAA